MPDDLERVKKCVEATLSSRPKFVRRIEIKTQSLCPPHGPAKTKQKQEFSSPTLKRLTLKIFKRKILCLAEIEILGAFVANSPDNNFRSGQRWRRRRRAKEIENLQRSELALSLPPVL